jgi:hypothetical protein
MGSSLQYFLTLFLDIVRVHPLSLSLSFFFPPWTLRLALQGNESLQRKKNEGRKEGRRMFGSF